MSGKELFIKSIIVGGRTFTLYRRSGEPLGGACSIRLYIDGEPWHFFSSAKEANQYIRRAKR